MITPSTNKKNKDPSYRHSQNREYEKSGLYPKDGKPFRIWALLGWLSLLIGLIAGASAFLNFILI